LSLNFTRTISNVVISFAIAVRAGGTGDYHRVKVKGKNKGILNNGAFGGALWQPIQTAGRLEGFEL
jgi:hypothetical protein